MEAALFICEARNVGITLPSSEFEKGFAWFGLVNDPWVALWHPVVGY